MSTPAAEPNPAAAGEQAGAAAAARGATPEEVRAIVAEAMATANQHAGTATVTDDQLTAVADRVIQRLDAHGAFHEDPAPGAITPGDTPADHPQGGAVDPPVTPSTEAPPRKKTFAEKFMGRPD